MAIWRAVTSTRDRLDPHRSSTVTPKYWAVAAMICAAVISGPVSEGSRSFSTTSVMARSTG